jgi:hypothetical protein
MPIMKKVNNPALSGGYEVKSSSILAGNRVFLVVG